MSEWMSDREPNTEAEKPRFNRSKVVRIVISILVAIAMWLYVDLERAPERTMTIRDIPVEFSGENTTLADKNLMLLSGYDTTIDLKIRGPKRELVKMNRDNVRVIASTSSIDSVGVHQLDWTVSFPDGVVRTNVSVEKASLSQITVTVGELYTKEVPVECQVVGEVAEGYFTGDVVLDPEVLTLRAQRDDLLNVSCAKLTVDISGATRSVVQTVDVLSPLGNNPRLFGQVAAANALSDVYAVGGVPWSAMNIAAFPAQDVPLEVFAEILAGGLEKIVEAGAVLAGGHTLEDAEIKYGLSVTGYVDPDAVASNAGLRPGDALVLTKPLGTGVLATAIKAQWDGSGKAEADLYRWATHLNANAAEVLRAMNLKAATDITGFGLGGHLLEMARGSRVVVEIDTASLPFIDNVEAFASDGLIPAGSYANRRHCSCRTFVSPDVDSLRATLVFDAQTSGGLVLAVPQERVEEALERLAALGEPGWLVGHVLPLRDGPQLLLS